MSDKKPDEQIIKAYVKNPIFISELIKRWEGSYIDGVELTPDVIIELIKNSELYVWRYHHMGFSSGKKQFVGFLDPVPESATAGDIADKYFACMDNIDAFEVNNRISRAPGVKDAERSFGYSQIEAYKKHVNDLWQRVAKLEKENILLKSTLKRAGRKSPTKDDMEATGKEIGSVNKLILIMAEALRSGDRVEIEEYGAFSQLENIGKSIGITLSDDVIGKMIKRALQFQSRIQK